MIRYNLRCEKGHAFESWFQSSAAYESQEKRRLVSCPACGSAKVERVTGTSRFVAYGVLNDAATSDGSYLPMAR